MEKTLCLVTTARGSEVVNSPKLTATCTGEQTVINILLCIHSDFVCIDEASSCEDWVKAVKEIMEVRHPRKPIHNLKSILSALIQENLIGFMHLNTAMELMDAQVAEFQHLYKGSEYRDN